jgi:hypothetical protein
MPEGKRSPTTHRTPAQQRAHTRGYKATPRQIKLRSMRNQARAKMIKAGKAKKGDGKDVGHKKSISKGGTNAASNLRVESRKKNRGHGTTKGNGR